VRSTLSSFSNLTLENFERLAGFAFLECLADAGDRGEARRLNRERPFVDVASVSPKYWRRSEWPTPRSGRRFL